MEESQRKGRVENSFVLFTLLGTLAGLWLSWQNRLMREKQKYETPSDYVNEVYLPSLQKGTWGWEHWGGKLQKWGEKMEVELKFPGYAKRSLRWWTLPASASDTFSESNFYRYKFHLQRAAF